MKKTIVGLILLIASFLLGLNFEAKAQYKLLLRGEPSPFDTAVAVQVQTYRIESAKMAQDDKIIKGQRRTIESLNRTYEAAKKKSAIDAKTINELDAQRREDEQTKAELYAQIEKLSKVTEKKPGFFASPILWGVLGIAAGVLIAK